MSTPANLSNAHQWTHDGKEVLIVKCVGNDGSSYSGKFIIDKEAQAEELRRAA